MKFPHRRTETLLTRPQPDAYGLLVAAATVFDDHAARATRSLLHAHDVRTTTATDPTHRPLRWRHHRLHRLHILVFPEDVLRAYEVLSRHTN
ncbi:hypothetical protein ACIRRA_05735 [Nocardia sp. NPDC101769]|uniref:hypothetical protein n=1 Tax=Nocardia sp. NPDC101769 TaxID=3364333 RepID=UPI003817D543